MATVVAIVAIVVATVIASSRLLRLVFDGLDVLAYAGLFATCWIGAGGALVPIPGIRPISWFLVVQQGAALDPVTVALVAAFAMVLGQSSYFLAPRRGSPAAWRRPFGALARGGRRPGPPPATRREHPGLEPVDRGCPHPRHGPRPDRTGWSPCSSVSAVPTPLTTLTTTAAAATGMAYVRFFPPSFAGFLVLCSVLALFGQGLLVAVRSLWPGG